MLLDNGLSIDIIANTIGKSVDEVKDLLKK